MITFANAELVEKLRGLEGHLRERGVTSLHVFGSQARGDFHQNSDLDLLVGVDADRRFSLIDLAHVAVTASECTGLEVNPVIAADAKSNFLSRVKNDLIEVF
jgi:predicted nucleotidyltransferase